jgi:hypothetical protein
MATFLQPVAVPERCYLFEVLLWLAFQRLPIAASDMEGKDIRDSDEIRGSSRAPRATRPTPMRAFSRL